MQHAPYLIVIVVCNNEMNIYIYQCIYQFVYIVDRKRRTKPRSQRDIRLLHGSEDVAVLEHEVG